MRWLILLTLLATLVASPRMVTAQSSQEALIESRLNEIRNMIDEETRTIGVLEGQLKRAIEKEEEDRVELLRLEIEQAWKRVDTLKELDQRLKELMETASLLDKELQDELEVETQPRPGNRRDRDVPTPRIAGLETREDIEKLKRELMEERGGDPAADADEPQRPVARADLPADDASPASTRLRHLQRSLQALKDAGEFDIARQVEQLIRREQERLANDREPRGGENDTPRLRRPAAADQPPSAAPRRPRPPREREPERSESEELRDLVTQMRDEIRRLRQEVNELKNAEAGDETDQ